MVGSRSYGSQDRTFLHEIRDAIASLERVILMIGSKAVELCVKESSVGLMIAVGVLSRFGLDVLVHILAIPLFLDDSLKFGFRLKKCIWI